MEQINTHTWKLHSFWYHCLPRLHLPLNQVKPRQLQVTTFCHMVPSRTDRYSLYGNDLTIRPRFLAVLAVWSLRESHLPWIPVEPTSMSKGIQPVLNHYSERIEGRGVGLQLCLSILWTASQHPKLLAHPHKHARTDPHSPSTAYSVRPSRSHMPTSKNAV